MRSFILRIWFAVLIITASCFAQSESQIASITGTITDVTGAVIPKSIVALEPTSGSVIQAITDNAGNFEISAPSGGYTLIASAQGFSRYKKTVHITATTRTVEDIQLTIKPDTCSPCIAPVAPPLSLLNEPLDLLLSSSPLPPYKFPARNSKHLHI
jgi:hypothetical protein